MDNDDKMWKDILTKEQYAVLRQGATEMAFSSNLNYNKDEGLYRCGACGVALFSSDNKYDSGSGWPSFDRPIAPGVVTFNEDTSHGMKRVEVVCSNCNSHLGHVFPDGPTTTGERYCINGIALQFDNDNEESKK
jgi:peptide-methionine (R)-S-oxide reductase